MPNLWFVRCHTLQTTTDFDSRGMTHDPRRYRNPTVFNPERFIPSEGRHVEPDPYDVVFGFGRRYDPSLLSHKQSIMTDVIHQLRLICKLAFVQVCTSPLSRK